MVLPAARVDAIAHLQRRADPFKDDAIALLRNAPARTPPALCDGWRIVEPAVE